MPIEESRPLGSGSLLARPSGAVSAAALVLSGSSGRLEEERARLLGRHGVAALAWRWFGGAGQPPGICEVSLESFRPALELLAAIHPQLAVLGMSKGAEAALLLAVQHPEIQLVVALSPSSVTWANVGPGIDGLEQPWRSSFTSHGEPLPFIPYDDNWRQPPGVPAYRGLYEQSLVTFADRVAAATIPVEQIVGDVILTAGGDDQVWPTAVFARQVADRRSAHGLPTSLLVNVAAGHRLLLPGEAPIASETDMRRGGSTVADQELGGDLWSHLSKRLSLTP